MSKVFIAPWRLQVLTLGMVGCFCTVLWRLADLHIIDRETLAQKVEANRKTLEVRSARRGNLLDVRGNLLAATRPVIDVGVDPQSFNSKDLDKLPKLAKILGVPEATLTQTITRKSRAESDSAFNPEVSLLRWVKLAEKVDEPTYQQVLDLKIKGVYGNRRYERYYPGNSTAAHVLGYIGYVDEIRKVDGLEIKDTVLRPLMGVEQYMDFYLRGQDGWRESEHDGRRRELSQYRCEVAPTDGLDVELTLDLVIQSIAESEVHRLVQEYKPKGISIIVSRPSTGELLALANYPTFDPNEFWKSDLNSLRNRAVADVFEPGSTFKIVAIGGALNEGIVGPETIIDCGSTSVPYKGRQIRLPKDDHKIGQAPIREIVYKSSNRGAAQLGMLLGEDRLYKYAKAYGYGELSGYGPGGEVFGILHNPKNWDGLTISRMPMGHAISATPMQVHCAMASVANGGVLMMPQIVKRVVNKDGNTVVQFTPKIRRRVLSPATAALLAGMLREVVSPIGTAVRASIPGYECAGKTGTTQKIVDGKYSNTEHIATFTGFFPSSQPELAMTIIVDEPNLKGTGYGGVVAAPVFKNIGEQLIQYLAIRPPQVDSNSREAIAASDKHQKNVRP
ncbi:MAG: penicillin-binding protein 2 [Verrucomicrobiota bacterium]|nr:penicillin-binding protein 2 [Verrucomicrobiota bacterium]